MIRGAALGAALLALAGCNGGASPEDGPPSPSPAPAATVPEPSPTGPPPGPPALVPEAEKGEAGARRVLLEWARAIEQGDYERAYALSGDAGAMNAAEHAEFWERFRTATVAVPEGTMEGAAGSLYYTVPASVTGRQQNGTPYRLEGEIVLRRANDVPGASPEQLRWHFERLELEPAS